MYSLYSAFYTRRMRMVANEYSDLVRVLALQVTIPHLNDSAASLFSRSGKSTGESCGR